MLIKTAGGQYIVSQKNGGFAAENLDGNSATRWEYQYNYPLPDGSTSTIIHYQMGVLVIYSTTRWEYQYYYPLPDRSISTSHRGRQIGVLNTNHSPLQGSTSPSRHHAIETTFTESTRPSSILQLFSSSFFCYIYRFIKKMK